MPSKKLPPEELDISFKEALIPISSTCGLVYIIDINFISNSLQIVIASCNSSEVRGYQIASVYIIAILLNFPSFAIFSKPVLGFNSCSTKSLPLVASILSIFVRILNLFLVKSFTK